MVIKRIALLFHDRGTRRASGQQHAPAELNPRDRPGTHFTVSWVDPKAGLDGWKISSPPVFDPPDRQARNQSLYWLRYPAHKTRGRQWSIDNNPMACLSM